MDRDRSSRRYRDRDEDRHTTNDSCEDRHTTNDSCEDRHRRRRDSAPSRKRKDHYSREPDRERPRPERKKLESGACADSQSGAAPNGGARQPLNSAPAGAVASADPVPSKMELQIHPLAEVAT